MDDLDRRQIAKANAVKAAAVALNKAMQEACDVGVSTTFEVTEMQTVKGGVTAFIQVKCLVEL